MIDKVKVFAQENNLIENNDKILVALSGGPDSVCLLHMLHSLKDELNLTIGAAHINHMLRGEEATGDELYVEKLCKNLSIPCYIARIDIDSISKKTSMSHEMVGRDERYKFFEAISNKHKYNKVAIAHNANDQAETVIMRMMRGTGLEGLVGIRAKRGENIIRPILSLSREEIETYCSEKKLEPRIDKTNLENIYSRNKVRLDILPYMKENFNEDIIQTLNRMASILQKDDEYINKQCNKAFKEYCELELESLLINKELFKLDDAIVTRVIKKSFIDYSGKYINFEMKHIYDVIDLAKKGTNKKIDLPNDIIAENIYGNIYLKYKKKKEGNHQNNEIFIAKEGLSNNNLRFMNYIVNIEIINNKKNIEFSNNDLIKYFDYDKIRKGIIIRTRKDGDKIRPLGMTGNKKLKDIFINNKVPKDERDIVPIICFDNNISWIVGHKVSEDYKVTQKIEKIIKIKLVRKE
ncbi:tRNA lysidine(34) synthetase TilS [Clostridium gasigenes]|uniref:tRNA lysidine(34) synthetase TilS n=1 Tax=Clostridium gasigenes TaxID=94869 RepID=UPI001C0C30EA|nr:tRNA lysidine(34) synthetase TilS [Clostridium gasigenes]MBU3090295.1 tRNA lysidine(34) synthetase TilS [Clostridium gasigenes]